MVRSQAIWLIGHPAEAKLTAGLYDMEPPPLERIGT
jgi:hypothetical protein